MNKQDSLLYKSTRGKSKELFFKDVVFEGLASDGGLYIPHEWPKLDNDLMMELKYPSLNEFIKNNFDPNDTSKNPMDQSFDLIGSCINKIYNQDEVWAAADCSKKEITDFLDSMNSSQFKEVEKFFETMPKLTHTIKVLNPKTKVESDVVLEGLASFFG